MATVGFKSIKIAILDDKDVVVPDKTYVMDAKEGGAIHANISGLGSSMNTTYASNVPFYVSAIGTSEPQLELEIADIPEKVLSEITGATVNEDGFTTIGANTQAPYVAVMLESKDRFGKGLYLAMLKGKFAFPDQELATSEDSGAELNTDSITGTFVARGDEQVYASGREDNKKFTLVKFEKFVFPDGTSSP